MSSHASELTVQCISMQVALKQAQLLHHITNIDTFTQQEVGLISWCVIFFNICTVTCFTKLHMHSVQSPSRILAGLHLGGMCCGYSRHAVALL